MLILRAIICIVTIRDWLIFQPTIFLHLDKFNRFLIAKIIIKINSQILLNSRHSVLSFLLLTLTLSKWRHKLHYCIKMFFWYSEKIHRYFYALFPLALLDLLLMEHFVILEEHLSLIHIQRNASIFQWFQKVFHHYNVGFLHIL